jgi:hypothetical protein
MFGSALVLYSSCILECGHMIGPVYKSVGKCFILFMEVWENVWSCIWGCEKLFVLYMEAWTKVWLVAF